MKHVVETTGFDEQIFVLNSRVLFYFPKGDIADLVQRRLQFIIAALSLAELLMHFL